MLDKQVLKRSSIHSCFFPKNTNAQVSDAVTWMVATIVIIVLLGFSIYLTSYFEILNKFDFSDAGLVKGNLAEKSLYGYLLKDLNGKNVYSTLGEDKNFTGEVALLAVKIFPDDELFWTGFFGKPNNYFGSQKDNLYPPITTSFYNLRVKQYHVCLTKSISLGEEFKQFNTLENVLRSDALFRLEVCEVND